MQRLLEQLESLQDWIARRLPKEINQAPLDGHVRLLRELLDQDLEPDPNSPNGRLRIREGVAPERIISVEDPQMRHGRKSKSKPFNGYKRHLAADVDTRLILACAVTPANRPEEEAAPELEQNIQRQGMEIKELHIDRGYISAITVPLVLVRGGQVLCKPGVARNSNAEHFSKKDFHIDIRCLTVTCPAGQTERFTPGTTVEFDPESCSRCRLRERCTMATTTGRTVSMAEDETLQQRLRKMVETPKGRQQLRQRVGIEHHLAHVAQRQGRRARYLGTRANLFDLRRCSAIQNLETTQARATVAAA